ncbi:hypothetical protein [Streptomyces profundus]|uniref:hypothetical protein n=1 Tax=Streptomyces profundus TaxID=2867410 RepID=UPI001D167C08|nr:hypothetical protein [Streptomyces sp. MA3_2.13]UED86429.1 hypothetical protein K4G22_21380 [Streptomyces sp. MA3_2.13]
MRVGITGHRGLPRDVASRVREALAVELARFAPDELTGVSCIADGPDAWFARAVLDRGGRIEVVIPAAAYREGLPMWHHAEYDGLLTAATEVHRTGLADSDSQAHMVGSEILVGLVDALIAVWDGEPARGYGGTADVVAHAERNAVPVTVLWPEGATRD